MRVLVSGLSNQLAGTEAVIARYVERLAPELSFDFLTFEEPVNYPQLFEDTDNAYFVLPNRKAHPVAYLRALKHHFKLHGASYGAVWANLNMLDNTDMLRLAKRCGIPRRIVLSHNSGKSVLRYRRALCALNRIDFDRVVTDRWACSEVAGRALFGNRDFEVLRNPFDMRPYRYDPEAGRRVRLAYGVGEDALLIGAVGRLTAQKNLDFLLELMPSILEARPDARLLIVGTGELEQDLRLRAESLGIREAVLFAGVQSDVQAYLSAFDVYVMPSLFEGLPLALLEAQANGLPCVTSDCVSSEVDCTSTIRHLSLDDSGAWKSAIMHANRSGVKVDKEREAEYDLDAQEGRLRSMFGLD